MYNQPPYYLPYMDYNHWPYDPAQNFGYEPIEETSDVYDDGVYRPEDAPTTPPPPQMPSFPATFSGTAQSGQIRSWMCYCLGKWGLLGLRRQGPFGRDFWFYPTEIRINGVTGYAWQGGRPRKADYRYLQIRNFMCSA